MVWTDEDAADIRVAVESIRAAASALNGDLARRKVRRQTREAITAAIGALLALDDVYFEREDGSRDEDVWRRARLTVRAGGVDDVSK